MSETYLVDGEHVQHVGYRHYLVKSKSDEGHHVVQWDDLEGWECSCTGWNVRKKCRHARAIRSWDDGEAWVASLETGGGYVRRDGDNR